MDLEQPVAAIKNSYHEGHEVHEENEIPGHIFLGRVSLGTRHLSRLFLRASVSSVVNIFLS